MYLFLLKFEIPENKLYEFDLSIGRLVKWPVYSLYSSEKNSKKKVFEFIREWSNEQEMKKDLDSQIFINLLGVVKVLGTVTSSNIYNANKTQNEFIYNE